MFLCTKFLRVSSLEQISTCSQSTRIVISGIPGHVHFCDIEPLLKQYGLVEECEAVTSKDPRTQTVHISYENYEQAQRYVGRGLCVVFL